MSQSYELVKDRENENDNDIVSNSVEQDDSDEDFNSFKGFTENEIENFVVTFNKSKLTYKLKEEILVNFHVLESSYCMKKTDIVGICSLTDSKLLISKPISECVPDNDFQTAEEEFLLDDDRIIAKKTSFLLDELPSEFQNNVYFQFCYLNSEGETLGISPPFCLYKNNSTQVKTTMATPSSSSAQVDLENKLENFSIKSKHDDSNLQKKSDEDEFIVVRSQDCFLKERIEHLTKSNHLLQYLIRTMEKDLTEKNNEIQSKNDELNLIKTSLVETKETENKTASKLKELVQSKENLEKQLNDLNVLLQKEKCDKAKLMKEINSHSQTANTMERNLEKITCSHNELKSILNDKEEEISLHKDMVENLKKSNDELNEKITSQEFTIKTLRANMNNALDECRKLSAFKDKQSDFKKIIEDNQELKQRVQELESINEKQKSEVKTLEEELKKSVSYMKNLDTKFQAEKNSLLSKNQKNILTIDKLKSESLELRARLEQVKVEYGNLNRKYQASCKKLNSYRVDKSISGFNQGPSSSRSSISLDKSLHDDLDPIDLQLKKLEEEDDKEKQNQAESSKTLKSKISVDDLLNLEPSAPSKEMLGEKAEMKLDPDNVIKEANTLVKRLLSNSLTNNDDGDTDDSETVASEKKIVKIPCIMCDNLIDCHERNDGSGQIYEMIDHLEQVHKQKMCPICSTLFDTRMSHFSRYFSNHIENHLKQMTYP